MSNGPGELLLNCTMPFMLVFKGYIMLGTLGGQPIFGRTLNRPSSLTKSNALVRSMKAMNSGICVLCTSPGVGKGEDHVYR